MLIILIHLSFENIAMQLEEQPKASFASMSVFPRQLENQRFSCHVDYLTVNREDQSICLDSGF
jgi:hypothetical protein